MTDTGIGLFFVLTFVLCWWVLLSVWSELAGKSIDWLAGVFASLLSVVALTGWVGVLCASFGLFSLKAIAAVLLIAGLSLGWWRHVFHTLPRFQKGHWFEWALVLLVLGGGMVYFRPHEYVLGGADAGTYINIGATIARTGKFILDDAWTAFLRDYSDVALREQPPVFSPRYLQFVGWYIDDANPTKVFPQFFPLHPTLIAVGMALGGLWGGLLVTPLWGVLGLVAVYLLVRQVIDAPTALLSACLFAITPVQIFFSRYPTAEPLTLLLVMSGLWAFQKVWDAPSASPIWGILGGASLGLAFLTRIDLPLVFILVVIALLMVFRLGRWSRGWNAFAGTFAAFSVYAFVSTVCLNPFYLINTYSILQHYYTKYWLFAVVGGGAFIIALSWGIKRRRLWVYHFEHFMAAKWCRRLLAAGVLLLSVYAYFLRPIFDLPRSYTSWPGGHLAMVLDGLNWVRIGWYVTPLGLLMATGGLCWLLLRGDVVRLSLFLAVGILTTIQYVYKAFIPSYHIYMMRRYLPIVIPMLMVYAAFAGISLVRARRIWVRRAGALAILILGGGLVYQVRPVMFQRDYAGTVAQITTLAASLKPEAILVINEPDAGLFSDTLGVPLRFIFGHDIATIRQDGAEASAFANAVLRYAEERQRPVQLLTIAPLAPSLRSIWQLEAVAMVPIETQFLKHTFDRYPADIQGVYYGIEIYNVLDAAHKTDGVHEVTVDVGTLDAAYLVSGFYDKERLSGSPSMRWTAAHALVEVPIVEAVPVEVEIRAMIYRPEDVPSAKVEVVLDGHVLGDFVPSGTWRTYVFTGHAQPEDGLSELSFATTAFNPAELKISTDTRDLGFLIDWIRVRITGE